MTPFRGIEGQLPEDLNEIAERLRSERVEASTLDLDRIKTRAMARTRTSRPKGFALKSRSIAALLGVAGTIVAVASRESDAAFLYRQEHPVTIEPKQLEALLKKAGDPDPATRGAPAVAASCRAGARGHQRNPWTCQVRYASGR